MKYNIISIKFSDLDGYADVKTLKAYDDRVSVGGSFVAFKLPRVGAGG